MENNKKPVQHFDIDLFDDFPVKLAAPLTPEERREIAKMRAEDESKKQQKETADNVKA